MKYRVLLYMKITFQLESAQLLVLGQFDLSFGAVCPEYTRRNFGRKSHGHAIAYNAAACLGRASISIFDDHGYVLGGKCDFWSAGGG